MFKALAIIGIIEFVYLWIIYLMLSIQSYILWSAVPLTHPGGTHNTPKPTFIEIITDLVLAHRSQFNSNFPFNNIYSERIPWNMTLILRDIKNKEQWQQYFKRSFPTLLKKTSQNLKTASVFSAYFMPCVSPVEESVIQSKSLRASPKTRA